jgi:hypothetical protein
MQLASLQCLPIFWQKEVLHADSGRATLFAARFAISWAWEVKH